MARCFQSFQSESEFIFFIRTAATSHSFSSFSPAHLLRSGGAPPRRDPIRRFEDRGECVRQAEAPSERVDGWDVRQR